MLQDDWETMYGPGYKSVPAVVNEENGSFVYTYPSPFQDNRKMAHELALAALKGSNYSPKKFYDEYFAIYRQALKDYNPQEDKE